MVFQSVLLHDAFTDLPVSQSTKSSMNASKPSVMHLSNTIQQTCWLAILSHLPPINITNCHVHESSIWAVLATNQLRSMYPDRLMYWTCKIMEKNSTTPAPAESRAPRRGWSAARNIRQTHSGYLWHAPLCSNGDRRCAVYKIQCERVSLPLTSPASSTKWIVITMLSSTKGSQHHETIALLHPFRLCGNTFGRLLLTSAASERVLAHRTVDGTER